MIALSRYTSGLSKAYAILKCSKIKNNDILNKVSRSTSTTYSRFKSVIRVSAYAEPILQTVKCCLILYHSSTAIVQCSSSYFNLYSDKTNTEIKPSTTIATGYNYVTEPFIFPA